MNKVVERTIGGMSFLFKVFSFKDLKKGGRYNGFYKKNTLNIFHRKLLQIFIEALWSFAQEREYFEKY